MKRLLFAAAFLLPSLCALADQRAAEACAAALPQDAKLIYDNVVPALTPDATPRDVVIAQTRALARAGKISQLSARDNAMKAGSCLRALR
jgi:hypothetical protein